MNSLHQALTSGEPTVSGGEIIEPKNIAVQDAQTTTDVPMTSRPGRIWSLASDVDITELSILNENG